MSRLSGALALIVVTGLTACGSSGSSPPRSSFTPGAAAAQASAVPQAHPQAIEPVPGAVPSSAAAAAPPGDPASGAPASGAVAQPLSDSAVRAELAASGLTASPTQATLTPDRLALSPIAAPAAVQAVIDAGNQIAHLPYVWGGGHGTYEDTGYDCSGSLSFVLSAAGLLNTTLTSGQLESWGAPGPGKWITVFAAPGHTFMYVAGLRFDTVALAETGSRWSDRPADESNLGAFVARHPPGL